MYQRFVAPRQGEQFRSEYDMHSDELVDLLGRGIAPIIVTTIELSSAGSMIIDLPGRSFVPYFWVTGTTNKKRAPAGIITAYPNQSDASNQNFAFPAKHNRGFIGSFSRLFITWVAQASVSVDLVIHRSHFTPWMTDDFDVTGGGGGGSTPVFEVTPVVANYAGLSTDNMVPVDASGGNVSVSLPAVPSGTGQIFGVQKVDVSAHTVTVTGGLTGNVVLHNQGDSVTYYFDGTNWNPWA